MGYEDGVFPEDPTPSVDTTVVRCDRCSLPRDHSGPCAGVVRGGNLPRIAVPTEIHDEVYHPTHYTDVVPGIECIDVVQHFNFNRGSVIKYVWRASAKGNELQDLKKARQFLDFEIERLEKVNDVGN